MLLRYSLPTPSPILTIPFDVIRSLSELSVTTLKNPLEPESITSAFVFPSVIESDAIVLHVAALPEPPLVNT